MSLIQKRIAIAGGLILSGMFLFPPWLFVYRSERTVSARGGSFHADETALAVVHNEKEWSGGYALIFRAPGAAKPLSALDIDYDTAFTESVSVRVDVQRLVVQAIGTALSFLALLIAAEPRQRDHG